MPSSASVTTGLGASSGTTPMLMAGARRGRGVTPERLEPWEKMRQATAENTAHLDRRERRILRVAWTGLGILAFIAVSAVFVATLAIQNQREARDAATTRINKLTAKVDDSQARIDLLITQVAEGNAKISALQEQVRQLGGEPVAGTEHTTNVTVQPSAPPTTAPSPSTPPTTQPKPTPPNDEGVCLPLVNLCVG